MKKKSPCIDFRAQFANLASTSITSSELSTLRWTPQLPTEMRLPILIFYLFLLFFLLSKKSVCYYYNKSQNKTVMELPPPDCIPPHTSGVARRLRRLSRPVRYTTRGWQVWQSLIKIRGIIQITFCHPKTEWITAAAWNGCIAIEKLAAAQHFGLFLKGQFTYLLLTPPEGLVTFSYTRTHFGIHTKTMNS